MMRFIYTFFIIYYKGLFFYASIFNKKAKRRVQGISKSQADLKDFLRDNKSDLVFIHCASQGEHEQARPIIRWIIDHTNYRIILSFYSPSGYTNANYKENPRLLKIYLPFDTPKEMSKLISDIQPKYAIVVKNEWWWNLLRVLKLQNIESYLVSATIRSSHYFIRFANPFFKLGFDAFSTIFVVDEDSKTNISKVYKRKVLVARDTRIDQANFSRSQQVKSLENVENKNSDHTIIYGSIWPHDLEVIRKMINLFPNSNHILYPHELHKSNIDKIKNELPNSELVNHTKEASQGINIVTSMGELKYAYARASLAYIGGGFGAGIHNILEAAVYLIPTLFGPKFQKSNEAKDLIADKCAFAFSKISELEEICEEITKESNRKEIEAKLKSYFSPQYSPTEIICQEIFKKRELNV